MFALECVSALICLAFLVFGSWRDIKTREIPNKLWFIFGPTATLLTFVRIGFHQELLQTTILSFFLSIAIAVIVFYFRLFGGADILALICITLSTPVFPTTIKPMIGFLHPLFPISLFCNSCLIALSSTVYMALRNAFWKPRTGLFDGFEKEPIWRKALAFVFGYKTGFSELERRRHLYPMEQASEKGGKIERRFKFLVKAEVDREKEIKELKAYLGNGFFSQTVWVSPSLPMLLFFTISYILTVTLGDIAFWLIQQLACSISI